VTVCIAASCKSLGRIVFVSDTLISSEIASVEGTMKFSMVRRAQGYESWIVMFAGYAPRFASLIERARAHLNGGGYADIVNAFETSYKLELLKRIEGEVLLPYGWTRDDFLERGRMSLGDLRFERVCDRIESMTLDIDLLVAGFDEGGYAHMFELNTAGVVMKVDQACFHAIGIGAPAALGYLYPIAGFCKSEVFENTLYRVCAAKFIAENAPGVGMETTVAWMDRDGSIGGMYDQGVKQLRDVWSTSGQPPVPSTVSGIASGEAFRIGSEARSEEPIQLARLRTADFDNISRNDAKIHDGLLAFKEAAPEKWAIVADRPANEQLNALKAHIIQRRNDAD